MIRLVPSWTVSKRCSPTVSAPRTSSSSATANVPHTMEYAWLEPKRDPILTDTNLAEIDFEDFRNEDLAYAFSCGVREIFFSSKF